jgi:hypothetical protein
LNEIIDLKKKGETMCGLNLCGSALRLLVDYCMLKALDFMQGREVLDPQSVSFSQKTCLYGITMLIDYTESKACTVTLSFVVRC